MEDVLSELLLNNYGLKLISTSRTRTGTVCRTDKGTKELRKINSDEKMFEFGFKIKEKLKENGFPSLEKTVKTIEDGYFASNDQNTFYLVDHVPSEGLDLSDEKGAVMGAEILAAFSSCARGYTGEAPSNNLGKLPGIYEKRKTELSKIRKTIKKQSVFSGMDLIVQKESDYYIDCALNAVSLLREYNYPSLSAEGESAGEFCHNSFKGDNIRITEPDGYYLMGFSKCALDITCLDLADYIRRCLKFESTNIETLEKILESYSRLKPLSRDECGIIYAVLCFPHKFFKLCNTYYNKRRVYISDVIVDRFKECVGKKENEAQMIKKLKTSLISPF